MRVVQFIVGSYGGAERFFVRLCAALSARVEHLVIVNDNPEMVAAVRQAGLDHKILAMSRLGSLADRLTVARHCRDFRADLVMAWMNRAARRMPPGAHVKVGRLGGYYPVKHYRRCDHLIANTPGIFQSCLDQGWPEAKLRIISNFSGPFADAPSHPDPVERGGRPFTICALGRFDAWKGFETLINAVAKVEGAELLLAGQGGQDVALREQVARLGLAGRVRFLGWIDDRGSLFRAADLCVVPSLHEPLGNVILEAWSAGCPVIAANSEGPSWLIYSGRDGLLVEAGDVDALAAALAAARDNPAMRKGWAEAGLQRWQQEFAEEVICRQYLDFFEQVTQARGRVPLQRRWST